jgi:hypothetical protein
VRLADLYDRLADRAETRGNRAAPRTKQRKASRPPGRRSCDKLTPPAA